MKPSRSGSAGARHGGRGDAVRHQVDRHPLRQPAERPERVEDRRRSRDDRLGCAEDGSRPALAEPIEIPIQQAIERRRRRDLGERQAVGAAPRRRSGTEPPLAVEEVRPRAGEPPVLELEEDRQPAPPRLGDEREAVTGEMVDMNEVRAGLVEKAREVGARPRVVEPVAAQRIAGIEMIHQRAHPERAVVELDRGAGREVRVGRPGVDRHRTAVLLPMRQPPRIELGAGEVLRRPAVHQVNQAGAIGSGRREAGTLRSRRGAAQGVEDRLPGGGERVLRHEGGQPGAEVRVPPGDRPLGGAHAGGASAPEAALALVKDERRVVEPMLPAGGGSAKAEVHLFSVAEAEGGRVEGADFAQQRALDVEAETDRGRNLRIEARRGPFDERPEALGVEAGRQPIDLEAPRDRGEGAVVGERRHGPGAR
jgi:hypothetical protein